MSYLVFARKYRPRTFTEVSGQEPVVRTLQNAIRAGRIAHAFLFGGPRGVGKTTTARLLAKALNCEKGPTPEPCGTCPSCLETAEGHSMDVLEIDGASNRGIDDVKALRESIQYNPARDHFKVVIIDEVHMLSAPAFNALLKTLEEPPAHAKFIFATTEVHKVPATILSRCQVYEFRRIGFRETMDRLREILAAEKIAATEGALALIARHADGCLRDAQSALDQAVAFGGDTLDEESVRQVLGLIGNDVLFETMDAVIEEDPARLLAIVDRLVDGGTDPRTFLTRLAEHVRNVLVARVVRDPGPLVPLAESDLVRLGSQAALVSDEEALRLLNLLALAEEELKKTSAPRFTLERTLLKLLQARRLTALPELVAAVRASAGGAAVLPGPPTIAASGPLRPSAVPSRAASPDATATASPPPLVPVPTPGPEASRESRMAAPAPFPARTLPAPESAPEPASESPAKAPLTAAPATPAPAAAATETKVAPLRPVGVPTKRKERVAVAPPPRQGPRAVPAPALPSADSVPAVTTADPAATTSTTTPGPAEMASAHGPAEAASSDPPPKDPRRKEAARARAAADPSVSRMRDLFKAEVVDVDEPS